VLVYLVLGATYGFAAAVQPGPFTAYLISQSLENGWRRTLPACLAPLITDGPVAVLALLVLTRIPPALVQALRLLGGGFVLFLAYGAWRAWRTYRTDAAAHPSLGRRNLWTAAIVNWLNPGPYLGWCLVLGPMFLKGWREAPASGAAVLAGFYGTMVASLAGMVFLFSAARGLGPMVNRALIGLSALGLACFGLYELWLGFAAWGGPP
jgi:threonine/homoserine/homoserine lactone efflux protein